MSATRTVEGWKPRLLQANGKKLEIAKHKDGHSGPKLVIGKTYVVRGRVPAKVRPRVAGRTMRLEARPAASTGRSKRPWKKVASLHVDRGGGYEGRFKVPRRLINEHDYRLTAKSSPKGGRALSSTTTTSSTTTATGASETYLELVNNTGDDLNITIPVGATGTTTNGTNNYSTGTFPLDNGETANLTYINVPQGANVNLSVQKQNCFGGCTTYRASFNYTPARNWDACSSAGPVINPGSAWRFLLTGQFGSGYNGYLQASYGGQWTSTPSNEGNDAPGDLLSNTPTCTFQQVEAFDNWIENNPAQAAYMLICVAVIVVAIVVISVATAGAADAEAAMLAAEIAVEEEEAEATAQYNFMYGVYDTGYG